MQTLHNDNHSDWEYDMTDEGKEETVKELKQDESTYKTKDLNQAAFIWCQPEAVLISLSSKSEKSTIVHFVFKLPISESNLTKLIFDYVNGKTRVEPKTFVGKQNNLRDLLHGSLRKGLTDDD